MGRSELTDSRETIFRLYREIQQCVPKEPKTERLRSDLAGLFVVSIASNYEMCVKNVLLAFADKQACPAFSAYVERQYEHLNSRVDVDSLHKYLKLFDDEADGRFKIRLKGLKSARNVNLKNAEDSYGQLLKWRHKFAHTGESLTTLEEALRFYIKARFILYAFYDSLLI